MNSSDILQSVIYVGIDKVNEHLPQEQRLVKGQDTVLLGDPGGVDSLTIISLVVALEQIVEENHGQMISLTSEDWILSDANGPLQSLGTLAEYLSDRLQD